MPVVGGGVGGSSGTTAMSSGAHYDPFMDTWSPAETSNAPSGRFWHGATWTGSEMMVGGGAYWISTDDLGYRGDGKLYSCVP